MRSLIIAAIAAITFASPSLADARICTNAYGKRVHCPMVHVCARGQQRCGLNCIPKRRVCHFGSEGSGR